MVTPSGRSVTDCTTLRPAIGSVYLGTRKASSRSWSHLRGQDQSSRRPSSVPIAIARRPTAERNIPGRAGPRRARGDSPRENHGIVVAVESNTRRVTAGGAPGARGGGSWEDALRVTAAVSATARINDEYLE